MSENKCIVCGYSLFDGECPMCISFAEKGECFECEETITSLKEHACDNCGGPSCCCGCPPKVIEEKEVSITYKVKVAIHAFPGNSVWDSYDSMEEAIRAWEFGASRAGAHHWDQETCHLSHNKDKTEWQLLYL